MRRFKLNRRSLMRRTSFNIPLRDVKVNAHQNRGKLWEIVYKRRHPESGNHRSATVYIECDIIKKCI